MIQASQASKKEPKGNASYIINIYWIKISTVSSSTILSEKVWRGIQCKGATSGGQNAQQVAHSEKKKEWQSEAAHTHTHT